LRPVKIYYPYDWKLSRSVRRIREALERYAPEHIIVTDRRDDAYVEIINFIGQHYKTLDVDLKLFDDYPLPRKDKYFIILHCPPPPELLDEDYRTIFENSTGVISYIPPDMLNFGKVDWDGINYLTTPWGVDTHVFRVLQGATKEYDILFTGYVKETEAHEEIMEAVVEKELSAVHIGGSEGFETYEKYTRVENISDYELVVLYNKSRYVSAMRHGIGFELPGIEGAFCGAYPIYLDYPIYRYHFSDVFEIFLPPNKEELVEKLKDVLTRRPPNIYMSKLIKFDWWFIARKIWRFIEESLF